MSIATLTMTSSSSDPAPSGDKIIGGSEQGVLTGEGSEELSSMSAIFSDRGALQSVLVRSGLNEEKKADGQKQVAPHLKNIIHANVKMEHAM